MNVFLGLVLHALGKLSSGSFYVPLKKFATGLGLCSHPRDSYRILKSDTFSIAWKPFGGLFKCFRYRCRLTRFQKRILCGHRFQPSQRLHGFHRHLPRSLVPHAQRVARTQLQAKELRASWSGWFLSTVIIGYGNCLATKS